MKRLILLILFLNSYQPIPTYGEEINGLASFYSTEQCRYNKDPRCPTASGDSLYKLEISKTDFAASNHYPLHSRVKVTHRISGKSIIVRILDRGPSKRFAGRIIDLNEKSFAKIGQKKDGLIPVRTELIK